MSTQLYKVTLTDLGTYTLTVAADSEREAESIAKTVLSDALTLPTDMRVVTREIAAAAEVDSAATGSATQFLVQSAYTIEFELTVPAQDRAEAARHARRLYDEYYGPFEFTTTAERVAPFVATEVQS
jgi:hypothetical protein